ncbi:uncharacterized protein LOC124253800 [Haliotis rubra]|uniref:uncharacterized protein LOC124253800 n=1 Tax=Haliotis rubra TaxID=36100 RepID=UPI001EE6234E|nr:uncharacterized protein LOC124253800 [Haliotis rubra]
MEDENTADTMDFGLFSIGSFTDVYGPDLDEFGDDEFDSILANVTSSEITESALAEQITCAPTMPKEKEIIGVGNLNTDTRDAKEKTSGKSQGRFAAIDEADLDSIFLDGRPKSTLRTTHWGVKIFQQWLTHHEISSNFEALPKEQLASHLRHFYAELRTTEGKYYSKSSFVGIRSAIHRHLRSPPFERNINILQDIAFHSANNVFLGMLRKIKTLGLDNAQHHEPISQADLAKIRNSLSVDTPLQLQRKVWFDLTLGFGRRGNENQRDLTIHSFAVESDDVGMEF